MPGTRRESTEQFTVTGTPLEVNSSYDFLLTSNPNEIFETVLDTEPYITIDMNTAKFIDGFQFDFYNFTDGPLYLAHLEKFRKRLVIHVSDSSGTCLE